MTVLPRLAAVAFCLATGSVSAQVTVTLAPSRDNTLYEDPTGFFSNGLGNRMFCGNSSVGVIRRALVGFDLSSIPACAVVTSVQLTMTVARTRAAALPVGLHRVTSDWGEGSSNAVAGQGIGGVVSAGDASWTQAMHPSTSWSTPGGDFALLASATTTVGAFGSFTWSSPTLLSDVQGWVTNPGSNFGWMIRTSELGTVTSRAFHTREAAFGADRPSLQVTYTTAAVFSVGTGCTGSGTTPYTLGTNGVPTNPNPGFVFQMSGGPDVLGDAVFLGLGLIQPPFLLGGCPLYVNLAPLSIVLPGLGLGQVPMPIPSLSGGDCFTMHAQAVALDSVTGFLVFSNAVSLQVGV